MLAGWAKEGEATGRLTWLQHSYQLQSAWAWVSVERAVGYLGLPTAGSLLWLCMGTPSEEWGWRDEEVSFSGLTPEWCFPAWMSTAEERRCRSWESGENLPWWANYSDFPPLILSGPLSKTLTHTVRSLILGSCLPHMAFILWEAFRHITLNLFILTHFLAMLDICF